MMATGLVWGFPFYEGTPSETDPQPVDLLLELLDVLGINYARPYSPADTWSEALREVQTLMREAGRPCVFGCPCHCRPDIPTYHLLTAAALGDTEDE